MSKKIDLRFKLDEHDKYLISRLRGERAWHEQQAKNLRDDAIAEKFEISTSMVRKIPGWNE